MKHNTAGTIREPSPQQFRTNGSSSYDASFASVSFAYGWPFCGASAFSHSAYASSFRISLRVIVDYAVTTIVERGGRLRSLRFVRQLS